MVQERFVFLNSEEEWRQCGAFCIVFYDIGKEDIVIIDDYYPFEEDNSFPFCSCEDKEEIWAPLLEKAYAKKWGSFSLIEGGFVHLALADLMNGIPEKVEIDESTNQQKLWDQLVSL